MDDAAAFALAEKWAPHPLIKEVIVAGVQRETAGEQKLASAKIKRCAAERPGRGLQMNLGAQLATGDVLLFHHVDSMLTEAHLQSIAKALRDNHCRGGAFYRKFDKRHPRLRWLEKLERWHSCAFGTIYGDQSVFIRRDHFSRIGGFAPIPLMEDVDFSRRLRRTGKIVLLDPPMRTSPQKQIDHGAWKITLRNLLFLILFRSGVPADRLHHWYYARQRRRCWRARWNAFWKPIDPEKVRILRERWKEFVKGAVFHLKKTTPFSAIRIAIVGPPF